MFKEINVDEFELSDWSIICEDTYLAPFIKRALELLQRDTDSNSETEDRGDVPTSSILAKMSVMIIKFTNDLMNPTKTIAVI